MVAVGGWEHACCGPAIERDQLVDLGCVRVPAPLGEFDLSETITIWSLRSGCRDESATSTSRASGTLLSQSFACRAGVPCGAMTKRTTAASKIRGLVSCFPTV